MRYVLVLIVAGMCSCTKRNPTFCCKTGQECLDEFGLDDPGDCGDLVCIGHECVPAQCTTSLDCSAPAAYCTDGECTPTCSGDEACVSADLPRCSGEGTCVECLDGADCLSESPICDSNTCHPCADDTQCVSGICLEAEGICAATDDVIHVGMSGTDAGNCDEAAPCRTVPFALTKVTASRRVIRFVGQDFTAPNGFDISQSVYVDGNGVRLQFAPSATSPAFFISNQAQVVIEHVTIDAAPAGALSAFLAEVTLWAVEIRNSDPAVGEAGLEAGRGVSLRIVRSTIGDTTVRCDPSGAAERGSLEVDHSRLESVAGLGSVMTTDYDLDVRYSDFVAATDDLVAQLAMTNGLARVENNVFVRRGNPDGASLVINNLTGTVRFNTIATVSSSGGLAPVLQCSTSAGSVAFTSNVFAGRSANAFTGCTVPMQYSLFDLDDQMPTGQGNMAQAFGAIFADPANADFHPGPASLTRANSEPALDVLDDRDGAPRPQPAGTNADIGAYEVP